MYAAIAAVRHFGEFPVQDRPLESFRMPDFIPFGTFLERRGKERT
jgi:hypothetical protein